MTTVIDTLRYANSLKEAGVEPRQAEAMSQAINAELTEGVATKRDLDSAVVELKGEIAKLDSRFDAMDVGLEVKFDAIDSKFEALDSKVATQGRYTFLVFALLIALGLYNAATPHFVKPPESAPAAQAAADRR